MVKQRQKKHYSHVSYNKLLRDKDSDSGEETELFVLNKHRELQTTDKVVEDGDTLQALAIKYRCSIADLKRINNIHNENEIFAKRVIKVPHRPFTLALAGVHISGNSSPELNNEPSTSRLIDIDSLSTKLTGSVSSPKESEVNAIIFNSQISPNHKDRLSPEVREDICDENVNLIPETTTVFKDTDPIISRLTCNGADADISWKVLLACVVIIIVAGPLIYVFYIAEHPEYYHHNHHTS